MRSKREKLLLILVGVLLLSGGVVFLNPTTRLIVLGYLRGEPFHDSRPVSWWINSLNKKGTGYDGPQIAEVQAQAVHALNQIGPEAWIAALQHDDSYIRMRTARAFQDREATADADAIQALGALNDN